MTNEQRSGPYAYNTTYVYDPAGNRSEKVDSGATTAYQYNLADELTLLTPASGAPTTSGYDANGNLVLENTGGALTSYQWGGENGLLSIANPDGTSDSYLYRSDGLRHQATTPSGTTLFVWDEQNVVLEKNASLVTQARYSDYPGYWGGLASQSRSGASSFFGMDSQGSSRALVSVSGLVTDSYSFKAFGDELAQGSGTVNPYRYIGLYGYYRDMANREYVRARYLRNDLGRWISRTPRHGNARWAVGMRTRTPARSGYTIRPENTRR